MNKQEEKLKKKRRIELYKRIIVIGFFVCTIGPILTSVYMLGKISSIEKHLDVLESENGGDIYTWLSSNEALASNPYVDVESIIKNSNENVVSDTPDNEPVEEKRVYLTFDDGPSIYTGQILDILAANDVKATFFVIGRDDEDYYQYYQRIVNEGHSIGMHSYSHKYDEIYSSKENFQADLDKISDLIYNVTGTRSNLYRFPGGSSNTVSNVPIKTLISSLNDQGIVYYDWNALNGDAVSYELSADKLIENIMKDVRKNDTSIVLMHDLQNRHTTVDSLQTLIDTLKSEGYEILPIDENTPHIQHIKAEEVEEEND